MPLVDMLSALLRAGRNGLPPTPDTLHFGCRYHMHSSHHFLSTWGAVMLEKKDKKNSSFTERLPWEIGGICVDTKAVVKRLTTHKLVFPV